MNNDRAGRDWLQHPVFCMAGAVVLIVAGWLLTRHLRMFMDIFFLDETGYLVRGLNMFPKIPKLWGPVYCSWYKVLSVFQSDPVSLFYLNFGGISVLLALVIYLFLIRFQVAWPAALAVSMFLLIAPINLPTFPKVSHFATIAGLSGLMAAYCIRNPLQRYLSVALVFLLLSYVRPEMYLAFLIVMAGIFMGLALRRIRWAPSPMLVGFALLAVLLHIGLGMPLGVELRGYKRSFIAFGEHFAYNYSKWNDIHSYLWLTWESVVGSVFGDSRSISDAFRADRAMMYRHFGTNLKLYLTEIDRTIFSLFVPLRSPSGVLRTGIAMVVLVSLFFAPVRRRYFERLLRRRMLFVFLALLALPSVISCILIYPRAHYLIMQLPLMAWLIAGWFSALLYAVPSTAWRNGIAAAVLAGAGLYFIDARKPSDYRYFELRKEEGKLNNLTVLQMFNDHADILEDIRLLSHEGDFSAFIDPEIEFVNALDKGGQPFDQFLKQVDPDMIYCTETMFRNPNYAGDTTWMDFLEKTSTDTTDWVYFGVNGGEWDFLLMRDPLYQKLIRDEASLGHPGHRLPSKKQ